MTYDEKHIANVAAYTKKLESAFLEAGKQAAAMAENPSAKFAKSFAFADNHVLAKQSEVIIKDLHSNIVSIIKNGNATEWALSNNKNDALVNSFVKNLSVLKKKPDWTNHNEKALQEFTNRIVEGADLSKRVWNLTDQFKSELEVQVGYGVLNGDSAAIISQRIRQYLNEPEMLFRKVRNEMGELEWSKAAKDYHPGAGKYRSSYKNARRLTVTETNMAYRQADHERWNSLGFVTGFEVKLSGQHPATDICDSVKGQYPKEFKFIGWHPQCLCHATAVTMGMEEFGKYQQSILDGTDEEFLKTVKGIDQVPEGFTTWVGSNVERSKGWSSQPYFIRDNFKNGTIESGLKIPSAKPMVLIPNPILPVRVSNIPAELIEKSSYLKGTDIKFNDDFFDLIDQSKPVTLEIASKGAGSLYVPGTRKVLIVDNKRTKTSNWHRESVIYHEFGHAIDWQRGLRGGPEVQKLMTKYRKTLSAREERSWYSRGYDYTAGKYITKKVKGNISGFAYVDQRLKDLAAKLYRIKPEVFTKLGISKEDALEQFGSVMDSLMALNPSYGGGHTKTYFKRSETKEAEFIAHCFENKFATNAVFKKFMPDLYQDMRGVIEALR